jgi:hypothetical protein
MGNGMVEDSIILKIKKLLALSKKNSNENEAAAAAAKAQELLIQHNLTMSRIDSADFEKRERVAHQYQEIFQQNRINWKVDLAVTVSKANLCKILTSGRSLIWIGKPSNIEVAQYLWETLTHDLEDICGHRWNDILKLRNLADKYGENLFTDYSLRYVHGKTWKNSFYYGALNTISERLNETKKNLSQDQNISALIIFNDKEVEHYIADTWKHLTHSNSNFNLYGSAYSSGKEAGKSIQFKQGMGAGGTHGNGNLLKG